MVPYGLTYSVKKVMRETSKVRDTTMGIRAIHDCSAHAWRRNPARSARHNQPASEREGEMARADQPLDAVLDPEDHVPQHVGHAGEEEDEHPDEERR